MSLSKTMTKIVIIVPILAVTAVCIGKAAILSSNLILQHLGQHRINITWRGNQYHSTEELRKAMRVNGLSN